MLDFAGKRIVIAGAYPVLGPHWSSCSNKRALIRLWS